MSDTASVISGAIPVVGGIVSTLLNNNSVDKANRENREWQEKQQDKQNEYNQKMWQMQTDYNNPTNTMNRYKAAGLNPNLIYGSATGNIAAPIAHSAPANYTAQPHPNIRGDDIASGALSAYNNMRLGAAQTDNLKAQATVAIQDAFLKGTQAAANIANTPVQVSKSLSEIGVNEANAARTKALTPLEAQKISADTKASNTHSETTSMLAPYQAQALQADVNLKGAEAKYKLAENERQIAMNSMNLKEAFERIVQSRIQHATSKAEQDKIRADTDKIRADGRLAKMDASVREHGVMPHDALFNKILGGLFQNIMVPLTGGNVNK